jgi:hypothetical protein
VGVVVVVLLFLIYWCSPGSSAVTDRRRVCGLPPPVFGNDP